MNAETKWTPGLWRETIFADGTVGVHAREGDAFVEVSVSRGRFARENARLIAASPLMAAYIQKAAEAGDPEAAAIMEAINASR